MADRELNLADLFEVVVDTVPAREALIAGSARRTYRELDERANRVAHYLQDRGVEPGAHVGILAHNCVEWLEVMIGCYKARTVPINLNFRYVAPELRYVTDNADLEVLVYERALSGLVAEALAPPTGAGTAAEATPAMRMSRPPVCSSSSKTAPARRRTRGSQPSSTRRPWPKPVPTVTSPPAPPTISTSSIPAAPPGCPKVSCGGKRTSSSPP